MTHVHAHVPLTRNQSLVLKSLEKSAVPLTAYDILDLLRQKGIKAPLQIYRALEKLVEQGLVHRVESINAFMACRHHDAKTHGETVFMICDACGTVEECSDEKTTVVLRKLARTADFALARSCVELRGKCGKC
jgi:Fur family transcriptional regulator, zinc uptake regulator